MKLGIRRFHALQHARSLEVDRQSNPRRVMDDIGMTLSLDGIYLWA